MEGNLRPAQVFLYFENHQIKGEIKMLVPVLLFALGLVLLIKGGNWFVSGATGIAHRFHLPELLIGATVVSIGTTLPEVMVSATSALGGHGEMAYGNAIGSIICNTALIAAITVTIRPAAVDPRTLRKPVMFFFGTAAVYALTAYGTGYFSRGFGVILLAIFGLYLYTTIRDAFRNPEKPNLGQNVVAEGSKAVTRDVALLVIGAALVAVGADLLVDNGTIIATALGVPESVIALTVVALGTSLPELVTAITALVQGHGALSLGNVIGANILNLVLVSGISVTLAPFRVPCSSTLMGHNASLILDIPMMLLVMGILTLPTLKTRKLSRWQGVLLLVLYALFCGIQFMM